MEAIRAFYRLSVMVGTLVVMGLAYVAYGPPVEELGPMCRRAGDSIAETIEQFRGRKELPDTERLALTPAVPATMEPANFAATGHSMGNSMGHSMGHSMGNSTGHSTGHSTGDIGLANYESPSNQPFQASPIANSWPSVGSQAIATTSAEPLTGASDRMKQMIDELNALGMGSHKLHRWGQQGEFFRFSCQMSYPGQAVMQQHFEAIADEPATAVASVLGQVKAVRR